MAQTLIEYRKTNLIVNKIANLEDDVAALKTNQLSKISFGNITLDGTLSDGVFQVSGKTVIDGKGLNSVNNFVTAQILNASSPTVSTGSYVDIPGSTMSSFTLSRTTNVLIYFTINGYMNNFETGTQPYLNIGFIDNGSTLLQDLFISGNLITVVTQDLGTLVVTTSYNASTEFASQMQFISLAAGVHQFKLQGKIDNYSGGYTGNLSNWTMGYIIFGS